MKLPRIILLTLFVTTSFFAFSQLPNILLIISDDMGVDATNGYDLGDVNPTTPNIDSLMANGLKFNNAWATAVCAPTRATIMSGKYPSKTGVLTVPGHLDTAHTSIFKHIDTITNGAYADAVIGKWHLAEPLDVTHPVQHGVDMFCLLYTSDAADED